MNRSMPTKLEEGVVFFKHQPVFGHLAVEGLPSRRTFAGKLTIINYFSHIRKQPKILHSHSGQVAPLSKPRASTNVCHIVASRELEKRAKC